MAKKKGSENRFPRLQLIEAPEDAGPAAAGMIELRADEATHLPYVIDDAGTTTPLGGAPTIDYGEDGDISTLDYDDTPAGGASAELARADHVHGMPSAGGGGGAPAGQLPVAVSSATQTSSSTTLSVTIPAAASGHTLIACVSGIGTVDVSSIASTNTTWTRLHQSTAGVSPKAEIWKGVVSGGSSGTTVTITFTGTNDDRAAVISEWPNAWTIDQSAMRAGYSTPTNGYMHTSPAILPTDPDALVVGVLATTNGTVKFGPSSQLVPFEPVMLDTGNIRGYLGAYYGFPGTTPVAIAAVGPTTGNHSACIVSLT